MNEERCICGHRRSGNRKDLCSNCQRREYWFRLYLLPDEANGLKVAAMILITVILLVAGSLTAMYMILGRQLVFLLLTAANLAAL